MHSNPSCVVTGVWQLSCPNVVKAWGHMPAPKGPCIGIEDWERIEMKGLWSSFSGRKIHGCGV